MSSYNYKYTPSGVLLPDSNHNTTLPEPIKKAETQLIFNDIQFRTVDLTPKDIADWRNAQLNAKSVYNPNRTALYDLYENILDDGHLTGIIGKRFDAVMNKELHFVDPKGKKVEAVSDLMEDEKWYELLETIMWTPLWGLSGLEFIPGRNLDFKVIPRKHIKPKWGIITRNQTDQTGSSYADNPMIWVMGKPDDVGLLMKCCPYAIYKRGDMADWSQYIEIFGQPVRVIKYDAYDQQTKVELRQVLDESGSSLAIMIPKQADFELKDGKQSNGDGQLQERFKDSLNQEMSVIILGNTETTTNGKTGTGAKSEIHQEQQQQGDLRNLKYARLKLNSPKLREILLSYGWPVGEGRFVFDKDIDIKKVTAVVEVIKTVREMGTPVDDEHVYEVTGIPKPENYEEIKAAAENEPEPDQEEASDEQPTKLKPKKVKTPKNIFKDEPGAWDRFRIMMANFFDQAHL